VLPLTKKQRRRLDRRRARQAGIGPPRIRAAAKDPLPSGTRAIQAGLEQPAAVRATMTATVNPMRRETRADGQAVPVVREAYGMAKTAEQVSRVYGFGR
jgi:hypothetical protein